MGCGTSTDSSNPNTANAAAFKNMVSKGNPLAVALEKHWSNYVKEQRCKIDGKVTSYDAMRRIRPATVKVNSCESDARKYDLSYKKAQDTARNFLGFVMVSIADNRWGGSVKYNLKGAVGTQSSLAITGSVSYFGESKNKFDSPYNVEMIFYIC